MASLQQLLDDEDFHPSKKPPPRLKYHKPVDKSIALPIYICYDRKKSDFSKQNSRRRNGGSFDSSIKAKSSISGSKKEIETNERSLHFTMHKGNELDIDIDEVAVKAVVSILAGYIGRFMKDEAFREMMKQRSYSCLSVKIGSCNDKVIENLKHSMIKIERLVVNSIQGNEMKMKSMSNAIKLLNIVVSINSPNSKDGSTCGVPNAYLSACAELYLSIVAKLEKKDRVCARHLLQVFCVSPFLARTHLLPELWERFFSPHLLHLKVWYMKEVEYTSSSQYVEKERRLKVLAKAYNDRMDVGTKQFALYYKEWLKIGVVKAPPVPTVSLPSIASMGITERRSSESFTEHSLHKNLYQTVFGPNYERRTRSMDLDYGDDEGLPNDTSSLEDGGKSHSHENISKLRDSSNRVKDADPRSSSQRSTNPRAELWPATNKSDFLRIFSCQSEPSAGFFHESHVKNGAFTRELTSHQHLPSSNFSNALTTICSSDILIDCEIAIRVVAKAWLDWQGDPLLEASLSKPPVIEGMIEILFISKDAEVLELAISILAELVSRREVNRQIILNSDPQLRTFMGLLRNSSLFLKTSVLIYLLKPKAKQMISMEWVPLVLRVLEFGDQLQTLFTVRCSPQVAAFYLLEQLLTGFHVEINLENARRVVSLGGLSMLVQRLETGGCDERNSAALFIMSCIQADGSCRHFIANNVKKASILDLLVIRSQKEAGAFALPLLFELLCLNRTQATKFLNELKSAGGYLNTMHILLVYLQRAPLEQRPLVAAILLQLDLLGDHQQSSIYREEVMDALVQAFDCMSSNKKVQEQLGRALLHLGGRFSHVGNASIGSWLLKQAGFDESSEELSNDDKEVAVDEMLHLNEEEEATEDWLKKATMVFLMDGNKRLLTALSESIEIGIPCLARASLITVAWMSNLLHSMQDASLLSLACSILAPRLLQSLNYDRQLEERVLASLSLLNLVKNSDSHSIFSQLDKDFLSRLRNLSLVTWTAEELLTIAMKGSNHWYNEQEIIPPRSTTPTLLKSGHETGSPPGL